MSEILYADECPQTKTYSSIDQFKDYIHTTKQGGTCPIIFDQIDYIGDCSGIHSHPVAVTFGENEYVYPEGRCTYASDKFIYADKEGVEHIQLPECFGGGGEIIPTYVSKNVFLNFDGPDGGSSLGVHQTKTLRVGLDYVKADESLPAVD